MLPNSIIKRLLFSHRFLTFAKIHTLSHVQKCNLEWHPLWTHWVKFFYKTFYNQAPIIFSQSSDPCEDSCPEPCSETLFGVTPSMNPLSDNFLQEFVTLRGQDVNFWKKNLVHLEIYLASMTNEKVWTWRKMPVIYF